MAGCANAPFFFPGCPTSSVEAESAGASVHSTHGCAWSSWRQAPDVPADVPAGSGAAAAPSGPPSPSSWLQDFSPFEKRWAVAVGGLSAKSGLSLTLLERRDHRVEIRRQQRDMLLRTSVSPSPSLLSRRCASVLPSASSAPALSISHNESLPRRPSLRCLLRS